MKTQYISSENPLFSMICGQHVYWPVSQKVLFLETYSRFCGTAEWGYFNPWRVTLFYGTGSQLSTHCASTYALLTECYILSRYLPLKSNDHVLDQSIHNRCSDTHGS